MPDDLLRLAIPKEEKLHAPTVELLSSCGVPVEWEGERRYTAHMPALPGVEVVMTRGDATYQAVEQGRVDLGILGQDQYLEVHRAGTEGLIILDDLGYGHCGLWVAVPDSFQGVTRMKDLADLALKYRQEGRELRVATKYPHLAQSFLDRQGVAGYALVRATGTLETFPALGLSDVIADIVSSGATLRENGLRRLEDGWIQDFQACLIANPRTFRGDSAKQERCRSLLERVEAYLRARKSYVVTANVPGNSPEAVAQETMRHKVLAGLKGPTIAPVYSRDGVAWFAVTLVVERSLLLEAVDQLRQIGSDGFLVEELPFIFQGECRSYLTLLEAVR